MYWIMFIVYETTNLVNGMLYIGVHNNPDDDYLGSGLNIKRAIKKYGSENFLRQTLHTFETAEEAYAKEAEIVTEDLVKDPSYYNINLGGFQPPNHKGKKTPSVKKSEANLKRWADPEYKKRVSERMKEAWKKRDKTHITNLHLKRGLLL